MHAWWLGSILGNMRQAGGGNVDLERLNKLCDETVSQLGYELVECQFRREPTGWVLRLFVDSAETAEKPISIDDCTTISRALSAHLDQADLIPQAYALEVSSPGLERPLTRRKDYLRFANRRVRIKLRTGIAGRKNFDGTLLGITGENIQILQDGQEVLLPFSDVVKAHLVYEG